MIRLRIERNDLIHGDLKYKTAKYTQLWNRIAASLEALGCSKQKLIDLKSLSLDPVLQANHLQKLQQLKLALQRVADLEDSLEGISYNLYQSTPSFVGREEELLEIHQLFLEKEDKQSGIALYGLGGVGKSELARQYCQQYGASYYKGNVLWINGADRNIMEEDFINIAERIKLTTTDEKDKPLSIKTVVNKVYRFFADRPVLFVFDNIINKSDLLDFLENIPSSKVFNFNYFTII